MTPAEQRARSLILKHFKPEELLVNCDKPGNFHPPAQIVHNIDCVATLADHMREDLGFPIRISSGFRSPEYNRKAGGTKLSQHQLWRALDLVPWRTTHGSALRQMRVDEMHGWLLRARGRVFEVKHREPAVDHESIVLRRGISPRALGFPWMPSGSPDVHGLKDIADGAPHLGFEIIMVAAFQRNYIFRFAGGVGKYSWGVHVDTRGLNHSWSG